VSETTPTHQAISCCPYCGEENLFPTETGWECRACLRTFSVTFLGLAARTPAGAPPPETVTSEESR
jgi:ribosomal protein L37AE/L43A